MSLPSEFNILNTMTDPITILMSEVDDLRTKIAEMQECLHEIRSEMKNQKQYPAEHKKFIDDWVSRSQRRREIIDKALAQAGGWLVISILGALGLYVYNHTIGIVVTK